MRYFAYGSNMDLAAMADRCPGSRPLGRARLISHRFFLMGRTGFASVQSDPGETVHGILFELAPTDVEALDDYEAIADGLYTKAWQSVIGEDGHSRPALLYYGADEIEGGSPPDGYMESVVTAAREAGLPASYLASLEAHLSGRRS